jgi:hypothetical protein
MPDLVQQTEITAFRGKPWKTHIPKKKSRGKQKNQTYRYHQSNIYGFVSTCRGTPIS